MIYCPQCKQELKTAKEQLCLVCDELIIPELATNAQLLAHKVFHKNLDKTVGVYIGEMIYVDSGGLGYVIKEGVLYARLLLESDYQLTQYEVKTITSKPLKNKSIPIDIETMINLVLVEYNLEVDRIVVKDVNGRKYNLVP